MKKMTVNIPKLYAELKAANCRAAGCDVNGVVEFYADATDEQKAIAAQVVAAHDPALTRKQILSGMGYRAELDAAIVLRCAGGTLPAWAKNLLDAEAAKLREIE